MQLNNLVQLFLGKCILASLHLSSSATPTELPEFHPVVMSILKSESYSNQLLPPFHCLNDSSLKLYVNLGLREIENIDDKKMELKVQLSLRQKWRDIRLSYDTQGKEGYVTLHSNIPHQPWVPDTFISNEKKSRVHSTTMENSFYRIYPNGTIRYSIRISLTASCYMHLRKFPFDTQTCDFRFTSYAYTMDSIKMFWDPLGDVEQIGSKHLTQFHIISYRTGECISISKTSGNYSTLYISVSFQRQLGFYMINFFIPCTLCVALTWISFFLGDAVEARLSLTVTILLTMSTQTSGVSQMTLQVSYTTAFSLFTGLCLTFASLSIFETAVVFVLTKKENRAHIQIQRESKNQLKKTASVSDIAHVLRKEPENINDRPSTQILNFTAAKVDQIAKILIPATFTIFLAIFFGVHLTDYGSDKYDVYEKIAESDYICPKGGNSVQT